MTRLNNTMLAAVLVTLLGANLTSAQSFRGVPWIQTDAHGLTNEWLSPALGRGAPWYIDIQDNFDRSSALANSVADTWSVGFVPPRDTNQRGRLSADLTADVGRWDADASLMVTDGVVRLATDIGKGRATMPWRVMPGLGDDYLLDLNTVVAAGETVTLAFYGDVNAVGSETDEDSTVGVLVLDVNRGTGADINTVTWKVSWDAATGRQTFANTKQVSLEEELRLQLAWLDDKHEANDLFDAWLETSDGNERLLAGDMNKAIDVHRFGFELDGPSSLVNRFIAAVPEPSSVSLLLAGMIGLAFRRRR